MVAVVVDLILMDRVHGGMDLNFHHVPQVVILQFTSATVARKVHHVRSPEAIGETPRPAGMRQYHYPNAPSRPGASRFACKAKVRAAAPASLRDACADCEDLDREVPA